MGAGKLIEGLVEALGSNAPAAASMLRGAADDAERKAMRLYHGTTAPDPIDHLDPFISHDQLGVHLGDPETASLFAETHKAKGKAGARVAPLDVDIRNPLRLDDNKGTWAPHEVYRQLADRGLVPWDEDRFKSLKYRSEGWVQEEDGMWGDYGDQMSQLDAQTEIQDMIRDLGHDGVVYLNRYELPTPEARHRISGRPRSALNSMTDEQFRAEFPEATDSYIAFRRDQLKSPFGDGPGQGFAGGGLVGDAAEWLAKNIRRDNPATRHSGGVEWLKRKQEDALRHEKALRGATTAWTTDGNLEIPTELLAKLKGAEDEVRRPGEWQYDNLMRSVEEEGWQPSPILVRVNHRGEPYIMEGNTRTAVAKALGIPTVPAEVQWINGAEMVDGEWSPERLAEYLHSREKEGFAGGGIVRKLVGVVAKEAPELSRGATTKRAMVNIGLDINGGEKLTPEEALAAIEAMGGKPVSHMIAQSDTEPTLVVELERALEAERAHELSQLLRQEAIAQVDELGVGDLHGPAADNWRPFNPEYFIHPSGKRLHEIGDLQPFPDEPPKFADGGLVDQLDFSGVHGYADGGEVNPDQDIADYEALRDFVNSQPTDIQSMTHIGEKPRRPVTMETFGTEFDLGDAPYDVAGPMGTMAQAGNEAARLGIYAVPGVGPFIGAGLDTAEAIATDDPTSAGMAVAFGPGGKLAKGALTGGLAYAMDPAEAEAGVFGRAAKWAMGGEGKDALNAAIKMSSQGADNATIMHSTGWFKDIDGHWKFWRPSVGGGLVDPLKGSRLGDVYRDPFLFEQYPKMKDIHFRRKNDEGAHWEEAENAIVLGDTSKPGYNTPDAGGRYGAVTHEIYHAKSSKEGWPNGMGSYQGYENTINDIRKLNNLPTSTLPYKASGDADPKFMRHVGGEDNLRPLGFKRYQAEVGEALARREAAMREIQAENFGRVLTPADQLFLDMPQDVLFHPGQSPMKDQYDALLKIIDDERVARDMQAAAAAKPKRGRK